MALSRDGHVVEGQDRLAGQNGRRPAARHPGPAAVRFHLHPSVVVARVGEALELSLRREVWRFSADTDALIEDSIFFADNSGARRTLQIVLPFDPRNRAAVSWRFERLR